jgi:DNA-binding Xre family transcriptional regulator
MVVRMYVFTSPRKRTVTISIGGTVGGIDMIISYKKLFKLLIDKGIKVKELARCADISPKTLSKMKKDGATITSDVLTKICLALGCSMNDITELIPKRNEV